MNGAPAVSAGFDIWVAPLWVRSLTVAGGPLGLDFYGAGFAGGVVVEAAPAVAFGVGDEASGDWIAVDGSSL